MIDLTPLDVRKKAGDFTKALRGYDTQQVDSFLELAAERLEELVKENLTLRERVDRLSDQVEAQTGREKAVNDALVTAQQLREDIVTSAERAADAIRTEARADADRIRGEADERVRRAIVDAEERLADLKQATREVTRRRARFLANYRQLLERELDMVEVQEEDTLEEYMVVGLGVDPALPSDPGDGSALNEGATSVESSASNDGPASLDEVALNDGPAGEVGPGTDEDVALEDALAVDDDFRVGHDRAEDEESGTAHEPAEVERHPDESSDSGLDEEDSEESDDER